MNLMLAMIVISEACLGICAWLTPDCLRRAAAFLLTRADVIDAARAEHRRRIEFWRDELGVTHEPLAIQATITQPAISRLAEN
jgi:hypothetical protein